MSSRIRRWKQDTPAMQAISILQSLEGDLVTMSCDNAQKLARMQASIEELRVLVQLEMKHSWTHESTSVVPKYLARSFQNLLDIEG